MPVYEDLIETGGRGRSRSLITVYVLSFAIILGVFIAVLARVLGVL